jgi:predicted MFS family arabinose efflux permease
VASFSRHAFLLTVCDAGAVIFPLAFNQLEPRIGFNLATRVLAFILLGTSVIPLALMSFPKQDNSTGTPERSTRPAPSKLFTRFHRKIIDVSALREGPFILLIAGLLTAFMAIYTILYYINLFAMQRTSAPSNVSSSILVSLNGASTVGRISPSVIADHIGPVHVLAVTALFSGVLAFAMLAVETSAGIIAWAIVFGSTAGAFMGLPAAGIVSVSKSRVNIGARLGMTLGTVGCGVVIAEPIAGAILDRPGGGWLGLVAWSGSLMLLGWLFVTAARIAKVGFTIHNIV